MSPSDRAAGRAVAGSALDGKRPSSPRVAQPMSSRTPKWVGWVGHVNSLVAVVKASAGGYRTTDEGLESYLLPKDRPPTRDALRRSGRGIGYTKSPYACLFRHAILGAE